MFAVVVGSNFLTGGKRTGSLQDVNRKRKRGVVKLLSLRVSTAVPHWWVEGTGGGGGGWGERGRGGQPRERLPPSPEVVALHPGLPL